MTESERLRKEMEERGLLGTTGKKVIVSAAQKKINEKKGGTAKSRSGSASTGTARSRRDEIVRDTGLVSSIRDYRKQQAKKVKTPVKGTIGRKYDPEKGFTVQGLTVRPERSNAKNEKTRLYQTHDNLLSAEEIRKKYSYVAQDKELDYRTMRRAVNNGMRAVGKTLDTAKGDYAELQKVAKLQAQLQGRLRSASFVSGLFEGMAKDSTDAVVKLIGNDALTKQNEAMQELFKQTQSNHKGMATAGKLTGEFAKAGAGYMTIGKAAEEATLKGMGALGRRMTASTAPDIAQQAAAKILLNPKNAKAARVAAGLLGQQAADTMVNTPMTIAAGMADGKSRKEIAKDIGKQEATDAAFNVGLAALGAGAKKAGQAFKKASKKGPIAGIDFEKMGYQMADVDDGILEHMEYLKNNPNDKKIDYALSPVNERMAKDVSNLVGFDISGYGNNLKPNAFDHVNKRHGADGIHDKSMANPKDIAKVQYILDNYDDVALAKKRAAGFTDSNGKLSQKVVFKKRINGTYYVVEAVPNTKKKRMEVIGTFMQKPKIKKENVLPGDVTSPSVTSKSATAQFSTDIIPKAAEGVKGTDAAGKAMNTAREETIQAAAESMAENRNVLAEKMTPEEVKQLEERYFQLQNKDWRKKELQRIADEANYELKDVTKANADFDREMNEIGKTMAQQEAMQTKADLIAKARADIRDSFGITDEEGEKQIGEILQKAAQEGNLSKKERRHLLALVEEKSRKNTADEVSAIFQRLRQTELLIDTDTAADIAQIHKQRGQLKGKLAKASIKRDGNISEVYAGLSKEFPFYFPRSIESTTGQFKQIYKIATAGELLQKGEKQQTRETLQRILQNLTDGMDVHEAYKEITLADMDDFISNLAGQVDYARASAEQVQGWHKERYRLQKELEKENLEWKALNAELTQDEEALLQNAIDGKLSAEGLKRLTGDRFGMLEQRYESGKALAEMDKKIGGYKKFLSERRQRKAADAVGEITLATDGKKGWKDKALGLQYATETQERNLYDIAPDRETADRVIDTVFAPIHENERKRVLMVNDYAKRLNALGIDTRKNIPIQLPDVAENKISESTLIHWLGEKEYELQEIKAEFGKSKAYQELAGQIGMVRESLSGEQLERINKGIAELRQLYKELWPMLNEARIKEGYDPIGYIPNYFPHAKFNDPKDPLQKTASLFGIDLTDSELPMDIAGRTEDFKPRTQWSGNVLQRKGKATDYDALRIFDQYIDGVSNIIYHTEDIGNVRALSDYMRYSFSEESVKKQIDEIYKNKSLSIEDRNKKIAEIYKQNAKNHKLQNYVQNLDEYANLLAGKKSSIDRSVEKTLLGRKYYKAVTGISNRVAGNMVAGNIGSALTNIIPITQGLGRTRTTSQLKGLGEALLYMKNGEMDELTKKSAFLATRGGTERTYKNWLQRLETAGGNLNPLQWMEAADTFSTQAVWRARYYDNMKNGLGEAAAIKEADTFARNLFAGRSKGSMPTAFSSKALKPLTMFQLEVNNQYRNMIKDIPHEEKTIYRKMRSYMGIVIGAYMFNDLYEKITGRRSAFDPLGMANEAYGNATGESMRNTWDILGDAIKGDGVQLTEQREKKAPSAVIQGVADELADNTPFVGGLFFGGGRIPLKSAAPHPIEAGKHFADAMRGEERWGKALQEINKEAISPLATYMMLPVAGGQLNKTIKGLNMMRKGGSYTQTNKGERLQFAVDKDKKANWAQALLFGKWATDGGKAYMKDKSMQLGEKQTETYKKLVAAGAKNTLAFDEVNHVRSGEKKSSKMTVLRASLLNEEQKGILYYDMVAGDKEREVLDHFKDSGNRWRLADCMSRMSEFGRQVAPKRETLKNAALSDAEKEYLYLYKTVKKDDREKERNRVRALSAAGLGMDAYLSVKNKLQELDDSGMKSKEKKQAFVNWMYECGYSNEQVQTVKDNFAFSGGYTVKW